ncbi:MAG: M23 family metallopeptidase [Clostridia bacterium]
MRKNKNNSNSEKRSLFIALAVCLVAIGVASLGTYNSVTGFLDTQNVEESTETDDPMLESETITQDTEDVSKDEVEQNADEPNEEEEETDNSSQSLTTDTNEESETENNESEVFETNSDITVSSYTLNSTYSLPVDSVTILQGYSGDELVYNATMKDYRTHNGVDIACVTGETVYAVNNGVVLETFYDLLLGNVVSVEHGDYEVWYCGLGSTFLVEAGEVITQGTAIGSIKEVPFEANEEPHIHIEVRVDEELIDPLSIDFF